MNNIPEIDKWSEFCLNNKNGNVFQTPEMYMVFLNSKDTRPVLLWNGDRDSIKWLYLGEKLKEKWDPIGATNRIVFYGDPLTGDDNTGLINGIMSLKKNLFVESRFFNPSLFEKSAIERFVIPHLSAEIPLISEDENFKMIKKDKRKGIKRAIERYKLEIIEDNNPSGVRIFYNMLKALFKKRGHPVRRIDFFQNINKFLVPAGMAKYLFVMYKERPIATQLALYYKKRIFAYFTATDDSCGNKYAGDLLIWHLLKEGIEKKFEIFDFGGGGEPGKPYSPREYKSRFGTKFDNIGRIRIPNSPLFKIMKKVYELKLKQTS